MFRAKVISDSDSENTRRVRRGEERIEDKAKGREKRGAKYACLEKKRRTMMMSSKQWGAARFQRCFVKEGRRGAELHVREERGAKKMEITKLNPTDLGFYHTAIK